MNFVILLVGAPGKMARELFNLIEASRLCTNYILCPFLFTGQEITDRSCCDYPLIKPNGRGITLKRYKDARMGYPIIAIDFSHPSAVNNNARFYIKHKIPFVMGTTGGDIKKLKRDIEKSTISAVVAPNMAEQIVIFQSMMKTAAETFPNKFSGYSLRITESHQKGKADTSGTAKAMVEYFNNLGIPFTKDQIKMIRDPKKQLNIGVPEKHLTGHGWHTYTFISPDGSVQFKFTHNINGRRIYAEGALEAAEFIHKKTIRQGIQGHVYDMIDVIKDI
jgi:4-hydroxy-tetrahydrodipicolinate reductase